MDRLFFKIYLGVSLALIVVAAAVFLIVSSSIRQERDRSMIALFEPITDVAQEVEREVARGTDVETAYRSSSKRLPFETSLGYEKDLPIDAAAAEKLARGEAIAVSRIGESRIAARVPGTDRLIIVGPIVRRVPFGEGRGPAALILVLGLMFLTIYLLIRPIERRLDALGGVAGALGRGDFSVRADENRRDSIGDLARRMNEMAARIERSIAAQASFFRMVSHELRTPLQRLRLALAPMGSSADPAQRRRLADEMDADLESVDALIEDMLTYARLEESGLLAKEWIDVHALVTECVEALGERGAAIDIEVQTASGDDADAPIVVECDPRLLRRVVFELARGAVHSSELKIAVARDPQDVRIDVTGTSLVFSSTLGAAIARRLLERYRGRFEAAADRVSLIFPADSAQPST